MDLHRAASLENSEEIIGIIEIKIAMIFSYFLPLITATNLPSRDPWEPQGTLRTCTEAPP